MPLNKENIISSFNTYFEQNTNFTKKEFLEFAKKAYDENSTKAKKNIEKKPLNAYQIFMKEQRIILNKRESEKPVEEKKKSTELMKEIAEMWKNQKNKNSSDEELSKVNVKKVSDDSDNEEPKEVEVKKKVAKSKKVSDDSDNEEPQEVEVKKKVAKSKKVSDDSDNEEPLEVEVKKKVVAKSKKVSDDSDNEEPQEVEVKKKVSKYNKLSDSDDDEPKEVKIRVAKSKKDGK